MKRNEIRLRVQEAQDFDRMMVRLASDANRAFAKEIEHHEGLSRGWRNRADGLKAWEKFKEEFFGDEIHDELLAEADRQFRQMGSIGFAHSATEWGNIFSINQLEGDGKLQDRSGCVQLRFEGIGARMSLAKDEKIEGTQTSFLS